MGQPGRSRRLRAAVPLCLAAILLAGCAHPARAGRGPVPITLQITPASGPPGTPLVASGVSAIAGSGRSALVCWASCTGPTDALEVPLIWNGRRFALQLTAPGFTWADGVPEAVAAGPAVLVVACLDATAASCSAGPPAATGRFEVAAPPAAIPWAGLAQAAWTGLSPGGDYPGFAAAGQAVADCGADPRSGSPVLLRSADAGRTWTSQPLPPGALGQGPAGRSACRALVQDPVAADTLYLAGLGAPGSGLASLASPPPIYTTDGGKSWAPVPVPDGYESDLGFAGFATAPTGVVAWFSRAYFGEGLRSDLFEAMVALQGGASWVDVPLACPQVVPCAWTLTGYDPARSGAPAIRGLAVSPDHGTTWRWATFAGLPLGGGRVARDGAGNLLWAAPEAYAVAGDPGIPLPLLSSRDGGLQWSMVSLPVPPLGWDPDGRDPPMSQDLRILPDGRLLWHVPGEATNGWLLAPGATAWCPLFGPVPANGDFILTQSALIWLQGGLRMEPVSALHCATAASPGP